MTIADGALDRPGQGTPFGPGSISVGLYPPPEFDSSGQAAALVEQAVAAEQSGFAGVTLSEHHGRFPGYMGQPLLACNWVLSETRRVWSGPAPYLLNLRNPVLTAEALAWTRARFPGRVGIALAPGYLRSDYDLAGIPFEGRAARFAAGLEVLLQALSGEREADSAVRDWACTPPPMLCAANREVVVRRAARYGLGLLLVSFESREHLAGLISAYRDAGGNGPIVRVRAVWVGDPPTGALDERNDLYRRAGAPGTGPAQGFSELFLSGSPSHVAEELLGDLRTLGLTGLNVRFNLSGAGHQRILDQIRIFGATVLPELAAAPVD